MPYSVRAEMQNAFVLFFLYELVNVAIFLLRFFIWKTQISKNKLFFIIFQNWEAATLLFGLVGKE